jgi:phospholipid transport system substrate-binding protein
MNRRLLNRWLTLVSLSLFAVTAVPARAADEAPDALIQRVSAEVLAIIKADKTLMAGDVARIVTLVDTKVMPYVNFQGMTASAVGPAWRQATPEQRKRLQEEFKTLLVQTYAGALINVKDNTISVKPLRAAGDSTMVTVRTEVIGRGDPVQLDYRLEKNPGEGWKINNLNVLGVWLVETYRSQFRSEINAKGIDGLITTLTDMNKSNAKKT